VPEAGWSYLVSAALDRCDWFTTIAECQRILVGWPQIGVGSDRRKQAAFLVQRELDARLADALTLLAKRGCDQDEIDALPTFTKRVAAERGYLWAWPDGRFTVRKDLSEMAPGEAEAEREANRAMLAEWDSIRADLAAKDAEA
jgi:hypothetical protein